MGFVGGCLVAIAFRAERESVQMTAFRMLLFLMWCTAAMMPHSSAVKMELISFSLVNCIEEVSVATPTPVRLSQREPSV